MSKDRESYSSISLEVSGVERGKSVLGLSFNFSNFQGFKELFFVLYYTIIPNILYRFVITFLKLLHLSNP